MTLTAACVAILLLGLGVTASAAEPVAVVADETTLVRGAATPLDIGTAAWGPKWSWMGWKGQVRVDDGTSHGRFEAAAKGAPAPTVLEREVALVDGRVVHRIAITTSAAQDYTMVAPTLDPGKQWRGRVVATLADGGTVEKDWPIGKEGLGSAVAAIVFHPAGGEPTTVTIDPPLDATSDGPIRLVLARHLDAGERRAVTIGVAPPSVPTWYPSIEAMPSEAETGGWFGWRAEGLAADSAFALDGWSADPAGSRGRVARDGADLVYGGEPLRVWGLNLTYAACAPEHELAVRRADFYARLGVNAVRLHKYGDGSGWAGILADGANTRFDPEKLERMDHLVAQLKQRGIFVKLSNTFGSMKLAQEGIERIPYADEWEGRKGKSVSTGSGALYLSRELQDLHIEQMVTLLEHTNPHTGLRYADDPAIMLVEMVNEESALFFGTLKQLQGVPTLRARIGQQFADWLVARYGSEQAVRERWGEEGGIGTFKAERLGDESLAERRVFPVGNPWFWDPANIGGSQAARAPRLYDAALFLAELQDAFYDRMAAAIRATGYEGLIMASNWQAGSGASHYLNLASDARFDLVDRHNYHGGGASMLRRPGGGSLSSGLQQVADRPFSLSEWIHVFPNQWGAEGPAIIGAYGLGLQGWDVSFLFQNSDEGRYSASLGGQQWDVSAPQIMAPFPAIARQVRRGDVATSEETAWIDVHYDSLHAGRLGVQATTRQGYDEKTFDTDLVPAETLAVQRVAVRYVEEPTPTQAVDLAAHRDAAGALVSTTGQLRWMPGADEESGWFTIDSPGTKAVVGFAAGTSHRLGAVTIEPQGRFGLVYVTAASPEGTIATDDRLLVVASGRAHNSGMRYVDGRLLAKGKGPVLMEPVVAELAIDRPGPFTVHVCDQTGLRSGETLPVTDGRFTIDGRETRTIYYEIEFDVR